MGFYLKMKKLGKIATLIIFSLAFSTTILNLSLIQFGNNKGSTGNLSAMFNMGNTYLFRTEIGDDNEYDKRVKLEELYKKIDVLKDKGLIYNSMIYTPNGPYLNSRKVLEKYGQTKESGYYERSIMMDWDFYKKSDLKIIRGRGLEKKDFEKNFLTEKIPVIVGVERKEALLESGGATVYDMELKGENGEGIELNAIYEVVGVYETKSLPLIEEREEKGKLDIYYEDTFVVFPLLEKGMNVGIGNVIRNDGIFFELKEGVSPEQLEREIMELSKGEFDISYISLKEGSENALDMMSLDGKSALFLGIILLTLSIFGAISMMLGHLMKRKREIGVKKSIGAHESVIFKEIFKDMFTMTFIESLLSMYLTFTINKGPIGTKIMVLNVVMAMVIAFLISFIPITRLNKIHIVELLKGKS